MNTHVRSSNKSLYLSLQSKKNVHMGCHLGIPVVQFETLHVPEITSVYPTQMTLLTGDCVVPQKVSVFFCLRICAGSSQPSMFPYTKNISLNTHAQRSSGAGASISAGAFIYDSALRVRAAKAQTRLRICAG